MKWVVGGYTNIQFITTYVSDSLCTLDSFSQFSFSTTKTKAMAAGNFGLKY